MVEQQAAPDTGPISREELMELFGTDMPKEVVNLLFGKDSDHLTTGQVRAEIRRIAAELKPKVMRDQARAEAFREAARLCEQLAWPAASTPMDQAIVMGGQTAAKNIAAMLRERANG